VSIFRSRKRDLLFVCMRVGRFLFLFCFCFVFVLRRPFGNVPVHIVEYALCRYRHPALYTIHCDKCCLLAESNAMRPCMYVSWFRTSRRHRRGVVEDLSSVVLFKRRFDGVGPEGSGGQGWLEDTHAVSESPKTQLAQSRILQMYRHGFYTLYRSQITAIDIPKSRV
jgi:hypothetical protein